MILRVGEFDEEMVIDRRPGKQLKKYSSAVTSSG